MYRVDQKYSISMDTAKFYFKIDIVDEPKCIVKIFLDMSSFNFDALFRVSTMQIQNWTVCIGI